MKNFIDRFLRNAAIFCIPVYIIFTFISHLYNRDINPLTNWLSDYGNPLMNPSGAWIYNLGCIIVAVLLAVYFAGMYQWYWRHKTERKYVICYIGAQVSGMAASVFLVLASVLPLGTDTALHMTFSLLNMIGIDFFLSFIAIAFIMNPGIRNWIGIFAYSTAVFNIITTNAFTSLYIAEWIYFLLFMVCMAIIWLNHAKI